MTRSMDGKKVVVLSDNEGLSRAIELALNKRLKVAKIIQSSPRRPEDLRPEMDDFDLIIVAMSSPNSEPVVALAKAALARQIGRVPILIISDKPFYPDPEDRIAHLDFPFTPDRLCRKVEEILQEEPDRTSAPPMARTQLAV